MSPPDGGLLLVNYHYVRTTKYRHPGIHPVSPDTLRRQVRQLGEAYHHATPAEVEAFGRGERVFGRPAIFFTFDDGLLDHLLAAEILDEAGTNAAFFVSSRPLLERKPVSVHKVHWLRATTDPQVFRREFSGLLDESETVSLDDQMRRHAEKTYVYDTPADAKFKYLTNFLLPPETVDRVTEQMLANRGISNAAFCESLYILRPEQFSALTAAGHVVGCHGHSHRPFRSLSGKDLAEDVGRCVTCLEEIAGRRPTWVSYPYGSPTAIPRDPEAFCREFGFEVGLTLKREWNRPGQSAAALNRINTNEINQFVSF